MAYEAYELIVTFSDTKGSTHYFRFLESAVIMASILVDILVESQHEAEIVILDQAGNLEYRVDTRDSLDKVERV